MINSAWKLEGVVAQNGEDACVVCHRNRTEVIVPACGHQATCGPCFVQNALGAIADKRQPRCLGCDQTIDRILVPLVRGVRVEAQAPAAPASVAPAALAAGVDTMEALRE